MQAILKKILERATEHRLDDDWRPSTEILQSAWPGLVGDELADVTQPLTVDWERNRLVVEAASETWRRELEPHRDELLARINGVLPWTLQELSFQSGAFESSAGRARDTTPPQGRAFDELTDTTDAERRIDVPDDLETSLDALDDATASSARRILDHLRNADDD